MGITRAQIARQLLAGGGVSLNDAQTMAPNGEFLAYINPKEAGILKAMGGSGRMTSMGIPSFTEDEEDTGDVASTSYSGGTDYSSQDNEEQQARDAAAYSSGQRTSAFNEMYSGGGSGEDSPSIIDTILGRTTSGINTLRDRLGNRFTRTKNYLTDPSNLKNMATTALLTSLFGPLGMVLSGIGRTGQFQNFLGGLKKDDLPLDTNKIENTELRSVKPDFLLPDTKPKQLETPLYLENEIPNLMADVSKMDLQINKMRGSKAYDLPSFKDLSGNQTLTQEELDGIRDGTITAPTGIFA